jgi:hypothetical protein
MEGIGMRKGFCVAGILLGLLSIFAVAMSFGYDLEELERADRAQKKEIERILQQEKEKQELRNTEAVELKRKYEKEREDKKKAEAEKKKREQALAIISAKAEEDERYITLGYKCWICKNVVDKKALESKLKNDLAYANKYGVINYGRRDSYVQRIKKRDESISEASQEYKDSFGKNFDFRLCKDFDETECLQEISDLKKSLMEEYLKKGEENRFH